MSDIGFDAQNQKVKYTQKTTKTLEMPLSLHKQLQGYLPNLGMNQVPKTSKRAPERLPITGSGHQKANSKENSHRPEDSANSQYDSSNTSGSQKSHSKNSSEYVKEKKTHKKTIHEMTTTTISRDGVQEQKKVEKKVTEETVTVIERPVSSSEQDEEEEEEAPNASSNDQEKQKQQFNSNFQKNQKTQFFDQNRENYNQGLDEGYLYQNQGTFGEFGALDSHFKRKNLVMNYPAPRDNNDNRGMLQALPSPSFSNNDPTPGFLASNARKKSSWENSDSSSENSTNLMKIEEDSLEDLQNSLEAIREEENEASVEKPSSMTFGDSSSRRNKETANSASNSENQTPRDQLGSSITHDTRMQLENHQDGYKTPISTQKADYSASQNLNRFSISSTGLKSSLTQFPLNKIEECVEEEDDSVSPQKRMEMTSGSKGRKQRRGRSSKWIYAIGSSKKKQNRKSELPSGQADDKNSENNPNQSNNISLFNKAKKDLETSEVSNFDEKGLSPNSRAARKDKFQFPKIENVKIGFSEIDNFRSFPEEESNRSSLSRRFESGHEEEGGRLEKSEPVERTTASQPHQENSLDNAAIRSVRENYDQDKAVISGLQRRADFGGVDKQRGGSGDSGEEIRISIPGTPLTNRESRIDEKESRGQEEEESVILESENEGKVGEGGNGQKDLQDRHKESSVGVVSNGFSKRSSHRGGEAQWQKTDSDGIKALQESSRRQSGGRSFVSSTTMTTNNNNQKTEKNSQKIERDEKLNPGFNHQNKEVDKPSPDQRKNFLSPPESNNNPKERSKERRRQITQDAKDLIQNIDRSLTPLIERSREYRKKSRNRAKKIKIKELTKKLKNIQKQSSALNKVFKKAVEKLYKTPQKVKANFEKLQDLVQNKFGSLSPKGIKVDPERLEELKALAMENKYYAGYKKSLTAENSCMTNRVGFHDTGFRDVMESSTDTQNLQIYENIHQWKHKDRKNPNIMSMDLTQNRREFRTVVPHTRHTVEQESETSTFNIDEYKEETQIAQKEAQNRAKEIAAKRPNRKSRSVIDHPDSNFYANQPQRYHHQTSYSRVTNPMDLSTQHKHQGLHIDPAHPLDSDSMNIGNLTSEGSLQQSAANSSRHMDMRQVISSKLEKINLEQDRLRAMIKGSELELTEPTTSGVAVLTPAHSRYNLSESFSTIKTGSHNPATTGGYHHHNYGGRGAHSNYQSSVQGGSGMGGYHSKKRKRNQPVFEFGIVKELRHSMKKALKSQEKISRKMKKLENSAAKTKTMKISNQLIEANTEIMRDYMRRNETSREKKKKVKNAHRNSAGRAERRLGKGYLHQHPATVKVFSGGMDRNTSKSKKSTKGGRGGKGRRGRRKGPGKGAGKMKTIKTILSELSPENELSYYAMKDSYVGQSRVEQSEYSGNGASRVERRKTSPYYEEPRFTLNPQDRSFLRGSRHLSTNLGIPTQLPLPKSTKGGQHHNHHHHKHKSSQKNSHIHINNGANTSKKSKSKTSQNRRTSKKRTIQQTKAYLPHPYNTKSNAKRPYKSQKKVSNNSAQKPKKYKQRVSTGKLTLQQIKHLQQIRNLDHSTPKTNRSEGRSKKISTYLKEHKNRQLMTLDEHQMRRSNRSKGQGSSYSRSRVGGGPGHQKFKEKPILGKDLIHKKTSSRSQQRGVEGSLDSRKLIYMSYDNSGLKNLSQKIRMTENRRRAKPTSYHQNMFSEMDSGHPYRSNIPLNQTEGLHAYQKGKKERTFFKSLSKGKLEKTPTIDVGTLIGRTRDIKLEKMDTLDAREDSVHLRDYLNKNYSEKLMDILPLDIIRKLNERKYVCDDLSPSNNQRWRFGSLDSNTMNLTPLMNHPNLFAKFNTLSGLRAPGGDYRVGDLVTGIQNRRKNSDSLRSVGRGGPGLNLGSFLVNQARAGHRHMSNDRARVGSNVFRRTPNIKIRHEYSLDIKKISRNGSLNKARLKLNTNMSLMNSKNPAYKTSASKIYGRSKATYLNNSSSYKRHHMNHPHNSTAQISRVQKLAKFSSKDHSPGLFATNRSGSSRAASNSLKPSQTSSALRRVGRVQISQKVPQHLRKKLVENSATFEVSSGKRETPASTNSTTIKRRVKRLNSGGSGLKNAFERNMDLYLNSDSKKRISPSADKRRRGKAKVEEPKKAQRRPVPKSNNFFSGSLKKTSGQGYGVKMSAVQSKNDRGRQNKAGGTGTRTNFDRKKKSSITKMRFF